MDVYESAEYVGSVRVRDRLRAFDLLGSTLVVLVERQAGPDDADGIADRALDWYDIGGLHPQATVAPDHEVGSRRARATGRPSLTCAS